MSDTSSEHPAWPPARATHPASAIAGKVLLALVGLVIGAIVGVVGAALAGWIPFVC